MSAYYALAGLQLAGGYFASQNIKESAKLNQEIADMNAQFAELDAYDAQIEGYSEQARYQSVIDQTLGAQQVTMTAQDIDVSYGTASTVQEETKFTAELNLMEIQKQAEEKALGYKRQARDIKLGGSMQAAEAKTRAGQAMFNSVVGAAQSGIQGIKRDPPKSLTGYKG